MNYVPFSSCLCLLFQGTCHWSHIPFQCFRTQFWRCSLWWVAYFTPDMHYLYPLCSTCVFFIALFHPSILFFNLSLSEGFPQTLICSLFNTSYVPMTFALRVLGDGLGSPSITSTRQVSEMSRINWQGSAANGLHMQPMEFTVSPAVGSVRAMSDINIKVRKWRCHN